MNLFSLIFAVRTMRFYDFNIFLVLVRGSPDSLPDALKWPPNDLELIVYFAVFEILSFSYLVRINKNNIFSRLHY